jgi:hypothetical protein
MLLVMYGHILQLSIHTDKKSTSLPGIGDHLLEHGGQVLARQLYWCHLFTSSYFITDKRNQLLSVTPLVKQEVLVKVPVVRLLCLNHACKVTDDNLTIAWIIFRR